MNRSILLTALLATSFTAGAFWSKPKPTKTQIVIKKTKDVLSHKVTTFAAGALCGYLAYKGFFKFKRGYVQYTQNLPQH